MLEIIEYNKDPYEFPCLLVLGCFDAVHSGHAELLKKARLQAKINGLDLGVMTFADGKGGEQVLTFDERLAVFESYNAKFVLKIDFNDEFRKTAPLDFLAVLEDKLNVKAYMSGKDFRFGAGAKGKSSTLKNYAEDEDNGVWYMPLKDVCIDGEKISTSRIKELLKIGDIPAANALLGREYFISGTVEKGAGRGRAEIGFPTLNLAYPDGKVKVKQGVYSVVCDTPQGEFKGIVNYGPRPTFDETEPVAEVYLAGFDGDLYGQSVTVKFVNYLRDIRKFDSASELSSQLMCDLAAATGETVAPAPAVEPLEVPELVVEEQSEPVQAEEPVTEPEPVAEEQPIVEESAVEPVSEESEKEAGGSEND